MAVIVNGVINQGVQAATTYHTSVVDEIKEKVNDLAEKVDDISKLHIDIGNAVIENVQALDRNKVYSVIVSGDYNRDQMKAIKHALIENFAAHNVAVVVLFSKEKDGIVFAAEEEIRERNAGSQELNILRHRIEYLEEKLNVLGNEFNDIYRFCKSKGLDNWKDNLYNENSMF